MSVITLMFSVGLAWAVGPLTGSTGQSEYFKHLLADYTDFAPRRVPVYHPRDAGAAASVLYLNLPACVGRQTVEDRRLAFTFFGELAALGLRLGLDAADREPVSNEYRRDLRQLMSHSTNVAVPNLIRTLVMFARATDFNGQPLIQAAGRDALVPVVDELVRRAQRPDLPADQLVETVKLISYLGTPYATAAAACFKVSVLRAKCDPDFL